MSDKKNMVYSSPHSAIGQKCSECGCIIEEGGRTLIEYKCAIAAIQECYDYRCDNCPCSIEVGEKMYICSDCAETRTIFNSNEYNSLREDIKEVVNVYDDDIKLQKLNKLLHKIKEKTTKLINRYHKEQVMTLNNQSFEVGDEVVYFDYSLKAKYTVVRENYYGEECPYFFHRDAVTIDEHGRLTAINHDYVKERVPKVVTKEPHEFQPFEKVLVRHDTEQTWSCNLFSHIYKTHIYLFQCAAGGAWNECIPYEGNEHLVGKVTE